MDIATTLSHNIKRLRANRGLTQKAFGELTGVPYYTVISIEHRKPTSFENLERIASAFETTPAELIAETPTREPLLNNKEADEADFKALPPFKQAFFKSVALELDALYGSPLNETYRKFKERIVCDVTKSVDLLDTNNMTVIQVKHAVIKAVCDTLEAN